MKSKNNKGFTLIEIMVTVLIIGILAAIALPQYNKSVERSRFAEARIIMNAIIKNAQLCQLNKGSQCSYEEIFNKTSIEYPSELQTDCVDYVCFRTKYWDFGYDDLIYVNRIPNENSREWLYDFEVYPDTGKIICYNNSDYEKDYCKMLGYCHGCEIE